MLVMYAQVTAPSVNKCWPAFGESVVDSVKTRQIDFDTKYTKQDFAIGAVIYLKSVGYISHLVRSTPSKLKFVPYF